MSAMPWILEKPQNLWIVLFLGSLCLNCFLLFRLYERPEINLRKLAIEKLAKELKAGNEICGWKYYQEHEGISGRCLYDGNHFFPVHGLSQFETEVDYINRGSRIFEEYISKFVRENTHLNEKKKTKKKVTA